VIVESQTKERNEIGKIEEIQGGSFTYAIYYRPEDTNIGREPYHSKKEVFKTSDIERTELENIISKCEVYKLKRYLKCSSEEKFNDKTFFFRQAYDPLTHKFSPELEPECFCGKFINPDDEIVECPGTNCEKLYHYTCITLDNNNCLACNSQLIIEESGEGYKKIKLDAENSIALTGTSRNMYEEMKNAMKDDGLRMKAVPLAKKISQNPPDISRVKSDPKKRRVFPNVSEAQEEKILKKIDEFSRNNSTKNMTDSEKTRQKTRESLYKYLLYGFEELRAKNELTGNLELLQEERKMLSMSDNKAYEHTLNIAREVEATIFAYFKSDLKRYLPKIKILLQFLIHEKNYELRVKILTKRMTAQEICVAKDSELAPSSVNRSIEQRKEELLKESMLREEKNIVKTHKGETVIEAATDFPEVAAKKDINDAPATEFETQNKIIEEEDEENERDMHEDGNYHNGGNQRGGYDQYNQPMSPGPIGTEKSAGHKSGRDDFLSRPHLSNPKLFDQNLRKALKENLIEKTYIRLQDRFNNFLKGKIKQTLVDSLDKAIDKISST